jgi:hypothetical protein
MAKPWKTSDQLIETVLRKIAAPLSQITFTEDNVLEFINEEFAISLVPSVLSMHEEYFVSTKLVPLVSLQGRYSIPDRAIGMKLRDLFWQDAYGNLFQMSQITEEDKAFFQRSVGANQAIHKYYIEGNDVVLAPNPNVNPTGYLVFVFFLRPNQLVRDSRAATITGFSQTITVTNANISAGDSIRTGNTILTAVVGAPSTNQFQIGASDVATATNLVTAINTYTDLTASNGSPSTNVVTVTLSSLSEEVTSYSTTKLITVTSASINPGDTVNINNNIITAVAGVPGANEFQVVPSNSTTASNLAAAISIVGVTATALSNVVTVQYYGSSSTLSSSNQAGLSVSYINGLVIPSTLGVIFNSIPSNITGNSYIDFLQTKPGHKIRNYDVLVSSNLNSTTSSGTIIGNTIVFNETDVPEDLIIGDYICSANECIIPQVPPELHNGLAERASARILASMGDAQGLQLANEKIADIAKSEGTLLDNRVDGSPRKITNKYSLLRWGRIGTRRRF